MIKGELSNSLEDENVDPLQQKQQRPRKLNLVGGLLDGNTSTNDLFD